LARPLWLAGAGAIAAVTAWRTWPGSRTAADPDRLFALLLVAALLVSPLGWIYYLPLAAAPLVALAARRELTGPGRARAVAFVVGAALLYLPMELTESGQPSALATLTLASAHSWGALAVWFSLVLPPAERGGSIRAATGSARACVG